MLQILAIIAGLAFGIGQTASLQQAHFDNSKLGRAALEYSQAGTVTPVAIGTITRGHGHEIGIKNRVAACGIGTQLNHRSDGGNCIRINLKPCYFDMFKTVGICLNMKF